MAGKNAKTLVYTWEWGAGNGHLRRFLPIASALKKAGHDVVLVVRDVARAESMFAGFGFTILATPTLPSNCVCKLREPQTFAGLAWNLGVHDVLQLSRCIAEWKQLLVSLRPSNVVADFGLLSGYVAHALHIPVARVGLGFGTPPPGAILNGMFGQTPSQRELDLAEQIRCAFCAVATSNHFARPKDWDELFAAGGPTLLASVSEFDPYRRWRNQSHYLGTWSIDSGVTPQWPNGKCIRALAYLKASAGLVEQCKQLSKLGLHVVLACDGPAPGALSAIPNLTLAKGLLRTSIGDNPYQLVVCNANHGVTIRAIELGRPVLMFPTFIEQRWNAQVVEQLGFGMNCERLAQGNGANGVQQLIEAVSGDARLQDYAKALRESNKSSLPNAVHTLLSWLQEPADSIKT